MLPSQIYGVNYNWLVLLNDQDKRGEQKLKKEEEIAQGSLITFLETLLERMMLYTTPLFCYTDMALIFLLYNGYYTLPRQHIGIKVG